MENRVTFDDGYYVEVDPQKIGVIYHFYTPDEKLVRDLFDKNDPTQFSDKGTIGQEIKKHVLMKVGDGKNQLNEKLEKIRLELSDIVEKIRIEKNEAKQQAEKVEEYERQQELVDGKIALEQTPHPLFHIAYLIDWLTAGERSNILYAFIAYCSQVVLKNPISVIALGEGGSGKTHIEDVAMSLLPQQFVYTVKSTTDAALFGFCDDDPYFFDGKIVNIGDMGGKDDHREAQDFKNAMKEMQSDGKMTRVKREPGDDGTWVNKEFNLYGKPCLTYTTVPGHVFDDQEMSRSIMLTPRDDNAKAVSIFKQLNRFKRNRTSQIIEQKKNEIPNIQKMVLALRERMEDVEIVNPYGNFMENFLNTSKYFKRDVDKYDGILRVITALNGYNRPLFDEETLFTTKEDILIFLDILQRYHESISANLSPGASDVLTILRDKADEWDLYNDEPDEYGRYGGITVTDFIIKTGTTLAKRSIKTYFSELNNAGMLKVAGKDGQSYIYVLMSSGIESAKDKIELSKSDKKILEFNYGPEIFEHIHTPHHIPGNILNKGPSEPFWNDFLPERQK